VVGNGLGRLLRQQTDEGHLDRDRVGRLVFVAVGELDGKEGVFRTLSSEIRLQFP
jgi:hypothetical protein